VIHKLYFIYRVLNFDFSFMHLGAQDCPSLTGLIFAGWSTKLQENIGLSHSEPEKKTCQKIQTCA